MAPTEKYIPSSVDVTEAPRKVTKQSLANTIREVSEYDQKQLVQELGKYA